MITRLMITGVCIDRESIPTSNDVMRSSGSIATRNHDMTDMTAGALDVKDMSMVGVLELDADDDTGV